MATILFIDGENFRFKCKDVFGAAGIMNVDWSKFDLDALLNQVLTGIVFNERRYYAAKIDTHPTSIARSRKLQEKQRELKTRLEGTGYKFVIAGRVKGQDQIGRDGRVTTVFKEKGVDVRIGVDMVSFAADNLVDVVVLASSDSDLQPAIKEVRKRGKQVVYLGFERGLNKGMSYTTSRTITIRDAEVLAHYHPQGTLGTP